MEAWWSKTIEIHRPLVFTYNFPPSSRSHSGDTSFLGVQIMRFANTLLVIFVAIIALGVGTSSVAYGQWGPVTVYYAPQPVTTYYAPAPVTTYYAPAPGTAYYAPAPTTTDHAPTPAPVTAYYAPAPAPVTAYYAPAYFYYRPGLLARILGF